MAKRIASLDERKKRVAQARAGLTRVGKPGEQVRILEQSSTAPRKAPAAKDVEKIADRQLQEVEGGVRRPGVMGGIFRKRRSGEQEPL